MLENPLRPKEELKGELEPGGSGGASAARRPVAEVIRSPLPGPTGPSLSEESNKYLPSRLEKMVFIPPGRRPQKASRGWEMAWTT